MTGIRFNVRQRRFRKGKIPGRAAQELDHASLPAGETGDPASPAAALVNCIPCPALIVDGDRKINALNDSLCDAFGVNAGFFHIGEEFADFARRVSLSGSPGLLAIGDLLSHDKPTRNTEIIARNGTIYEARSCRTPDDKTLITLTEPRPSDSDAPSDYSHNIVKNMPGAVLGIARRPDGFIQCLYANTEAQELLGMVLRELTGADFDFRHVISASQRADFERSLRQSVEISQPFDMEFQVENAATGPRWVRCLATATRGTDNTVIYYLRMLDIEDRRRVAEEHRRLQVLLDMVVDNIPMMVNVKDTRDHSFVVVNRAFEEMTGLSRDDVIGRNDLRPFSEWDRDDRMACYERLLKGERVLDLPETEVETPNRGKRFLKSRKYPLVDHMGDIRYVLSITEDITERRVAENALRLSEQRLRDAIESLTDGVALFDTENRLLMCNMRYRTMWPGHETVAVPGVTLEELLRHYFELAARQDSSINIDAAVAGTLKRHSVARSVRDVPVFDGRWFQVSNHPTSDGGFAITYTDITALKEREESLREASQQALRAKEIAEGANRSKSDFLANMSHELRTPLNAVIGFSEIIKEALLGDQSIEPYLGYAQDIHESGSHLLSLINDILDMSKIEAGKLELVDEHVDLDEAVDACMRLVKERAHQNRILLTTDLADDLPKLNCDLRKFKQIAINLLSNAVKFTPEGGTINTRIFIGDHGDLCLRITDTGIGISKDQLDKVLEPFGQAEAGLNRQYEGTGLGLTLTQALTELHGGWLEIESETEGPAQGTTVTATFPKSRVVT